MPYFNAKMFKKLKDQKFAVHSMFNGGFFFVLLFLSPKIIPLSMTNMAIASLHGFLDSQ